MIDIAEIKSAVKALPKKDLALFSSWFGRFEEERWDKQIENDQEAGPLRDLIKEAVVDFKAGKCNPL